VTAAHVINTAVVVVLVASAVVLWRLCRTPRRRPVACRQVWDAEAQRWVYAPPATDPDTRPGTNAAVQDELELIYALPAYDPAWDAGRERLWNPIHDEHTEGEL
jgi:hypothetical protein